MHVLCCGFFPLWQKRQCASFTLTKSRGVDIYSRVRVKGYRTLSKKKKNNLHPFRIFDPIPPGATRIDGNEFTLTCQDSVFSF